MKKIISDIAAAAVIGTLAWVSWWAAAVIETGVPMPRYVFAVMVGIYVCLVLGVVTAVVYGLVWIRRKRSRSARCLGTIYPDGRGGYYIKK
ncbi:MAG: hypothetical protein E7638_04725 [Ruminococcaceae bacterium]|nr:hypothetical protein [Oscillospiraceae bacterium]